MSKCGSATLLIPPWGAADVLVGLGALSTPESGKQLVRQLRSIFRRELQRLGLDFVEGCRHLGTKQFAGVDDVQEARSGGPAAAEALGHAGLGENRLHKVLCDAQETPVRMRPRGVAQSLRAQGQVRCAEQSKKATRSRSLHGPTRCCVPCSPSSRTTPHITTRQWMTRRRLSNVMLPGGSSCQSSTATFRRLRLERLNRRRSGSSVVIHLRTACGGPGQRSRGRGCLSR
jgi:hypothetical protein